MALSVPIFQLKRAAKTLSRTEKFRCIKRSIVLLLKKGLIVGANCPPVLLHCHSLLCLTSTPMEQVSGIA